MGGNDPHSDEIERRITYLRDLQEHINAVRGNFAVVATAVAFVVLGLIQVVFGGFDFMGLGHLIKNSDTLTGFQRYLNDSHTGGAWGYWVIVLFLAGASSSAGFALLAIADIVRGLNSNFIEIDHGQQMEHALLLPSAPADIRSTVESHVEQWLANDKAYQQMSKENQKKAYDSLYKSVEIRYLLDEQDILIERKKTEFAHVARYQVLSSTHLKKALAALFIAAFVCFLDGVTNSGITLLNGIYLVSVTAVIPLVLFAVAWKNRRKTDTLIPRSNATN